MAPTHTGNNSHRTLSIMSGPNNNALASSNNRMRVIHIGIIIKQSPIIVTIKRDNQPLPTTRKNPIPLQILIIYL